MAKQRHSAEQIIAKLRQIEVMLGQGKSHASTLEARIQWLTEQDPEGLKLF